MINVLLDQPEVAHALVTANKAEVLEGYVAEMLRVDPPVQGVYREAKAGETVGSTSINAGDLIYLNVASANLNVSFDAPRRLDRISQSALGARIRESHENRSHSA